MKIDRKFAATFFLFTILGLAGAGTLYLLGNTAIKTTDVYFYPSDPWDWTQADSSFQLHGRFYFPIGYVEGNEYPTAIMFHGLGRSLEDNDYLARKLGAMGIVTFSISFRGHGNSGGFYNDSLYPNQTENFGDALGAYRYATEQEWVNSARLLAHGTSMGGGASMYLAELGLVPTFVVWYPALGYIVRNFTLYEHVSTDPDFKGHIIAGTADECGVCLPSYNQELVANNPSVEIHWHEGATHTDSKFFLESIELTMAWISSTWSIPEPNWLVDWYTSWVLGAIVAGFVVVFDVFWMVSQILTRKKKQE